MNDLKDLKVLTLDERLDKLESLLAEFEKNQEKSREHRDAANSESDWFSWEVFTWAYEE